LASLLIKRSRTVASAPSLARADGLSLRRLRSLSRDRVRPVWRELRPLAIVALAVTVLVLGTIGFQKYRSDYDMFDSLYRALQLFGFGGTLEPPIPFTLQVARILGPIVTGYAAIRGVAALSREQLQLFWFRFFLRNHVVVAGLGTAGYRMAVSYYQKGYRVIAIERDAATPAIQGCRERGIGVLKGDATDRSLLTKARVDRASTLIVTCGSDTRNMDVAAAVSAQTASRGRGVLTALVHLDDFSFLAMMKAQSLTNESGSTFRLALFNVYATGAKLLLEDHPPFRGRRAPQARHIVIVGYEGVARSLALNVLKRWRIVQKDPQDRLLITFAGPSAERDRREFASCYAETDEAPEFELAAWEVDFESADLRQAPLDVEPSMIYVCVESETKALTIALTVSRRHDTAETPIVVALPDDASGMAAILRSGGEALRDVEPFGVLNTAFSPDALYHTTNELLARASHETHVRSQIAKGLTAGEDPSLVSWDELPDLLKESNRLFADDIPSKLATIGCLATPAPLIDPGGPLLEFTSEEIELLARLEHDRWSEDGLRHLGMRKTSGAKDPNRGLHPLIGVPFDDLPEDNKEKDRAKVRSVPEILAVAGYEVVRMTEQPAKRSAAATDPQTHTEPIHLTPPEPMAKV
jgi:hypothetical protein